MLSAFIQVLFVVVIIAAAIAYFIKRKKKLDEMDWDDQ